MIQLNFLIVAVMIMFLSCSKNDNTIQDPSPPEGYNMLLIGNSFFKPYANNLEVLALDAGIENHNATIVFRGGANGQPINLWNDLESNEHKEIKAVLDQGDVELFGMTSGHDYENPDDRIEGHRAWIEYALRNNPDISVFIAIPTVDYPSEWDVFVQEHGYNSIQEFYGYFVNEMVHHEMVDRLRIEFPSTNIFTIPTGWAAINLAQMQQHDLLSDDITMSGPKATSIFTDYKGHQGQIVIETGTLLWLNSIYNVDLSTNTYETGFNTDLHEIAKQIMDSHDPNYKQ
ncbi:hypothetical protein KEM09_07695 [Carboxylicivirga mesophila]|uniref:DUF4886 domain-containing protein n=1 Tax=Carboxylicivirga mesophila TaxID=1166478 RepID=A0ABS5KA89_9BACT|nr:hypothetical protein [Carboxylicivirga mesophila]MBS2211278.1 hypothetical protein [Carboxylicivirga mesophila]